MTKIKIIAKDTPMQRTIVPEGTHPTRIVQVIHMGHVENYFGDKKDQVRITFEFPTQKHTFKEEEGPQPLWLSQDYTLNFGEKSILRKLSKACDLKPKVDEEDGFEYMDVTDLAGRACLLGIEHKESKKGTMYPKIASYSPLIAGMEVDEPSTQPLIYSVLQHDSEGFSKLPEWIQEKIQETDEYKSAHEDKSMSEDPFETI